MVGTLSQVLIASLVLSAFGFGLFTFPHGQLQPVAAALLGVSYDNYLGFLTSHFIFQTFNDFLAQEIVLAFLLLGAFVLEKETPYIKSIDFLVFGFLPAVFLTITKAVAAGYFGFPFYNNGPSILSFYLLGFFLIAAWKLAETRGIGFQQGIDAIIRLLAKLELLEEKRLALVHILTTGLAAFLIFVYVPLAFVKIPIDVSAFDSLFAVACMMVGAIIAFFKRVHEADWMS